MLPWSADSGDASKRSMRWTRAIAAFGLVAALLVTPLLYLSLGEAQADVLRPLTAIPLSERLVSPRSHHGMKVGIEYPIRASGLWCGVRSTIDFDGSFWTPADHPSPEWIGAIAGSLLMVDANTAVLKNDEGHVLTLVRSSAMKADPECGHRGVELF